MGDIESEESNAVSSRGTRNVEHPMSIIGYFIAVVLMAIGLIYFSREAYVIVAGEGGIEALQAVAHLVLAGALFSLATFIMVATYIAGQS